jgi:hypothetical protein
VPFHVEVRRSFRRAWAFNLDERKLHGTVVEPWRRGVKIELGGQEWDPRDCALKILEGPALEAPDLGHGRGWSNAERTARDVTAGFLGAEPLVVAVLAETPEGERRMAEALAGMGVHMIEWAAVRARILAAATVVGDRPVEAVVGVAAVLLLERANPGDEWLFQAGLALGALGGRAIVAQDGDAMPPHELRDLAVVRLDSEQPASLHALAERLRQAGR